MTEKDLNVRLWKKSGVIKAIASVTIGGMYVVNGIKIVEGSKGLFVAMPSKPKKNKDGVIMSEDGKPEYVDVFHPISLEGRQLLEKVIMDEYNKAE